MIWIRGASKAWSRPTTRLPRLTFGLCGPSKTIRTRAPSLTSRMIRWKRVRSSGFATLAASANEPHRDGQTHHEPPPSVSYEWKNQLDTSMPTCMQASKCALLTPSSAMTRLLLMDSRANQAICSHPEAALAQARVEHRQRSSMPPARPTRLVLPPRGASKGPSRPSCRFRARDACKRPALTRQELADGPDGWDIEVCDGVQRSTCLCESKPDAERVETCTCSKDSAFIPSSLPGCRHPQGRRCPPDVSYWRFLCIPTTFSVIIH